MGSRHGANTLFATSASAQSARDIRGPSPLVAIENNAPAKLIVDPRFPSRWPGASSSSHALELAPRICLAVRLKKRENSDYFESHPKNPD
jgi:hypothetical protein